MGLIMLLLLCVIWEVYCILADAYILDPHSLFSLPYPLKKEHTYRKILGFMAEMTEVKGLAGSMSNFFFCFVIHPIS